MAKEQETPEVDEQEQTAVEQNPIDALLRDGSVTLTGDSRQNIYDQGEALVTNLPAGTKWTRTIVDFNAGLFSQTYTLIKD